MIDSVDGEDGLGRGILFEGFDRGFFWGVIGLLDNHDGAALEEDEGSGVGDVSKEGIDQVGLRWDKVLDPVFVDFCFEGVLFLSFVTFVNVEADDENAG